MANSSKKAEHDQRDTVDELDDEDDINMELEADFSKSAFAKFFTLVSETAKNINVKCKLCPKTYSTSKNSKSNLKIHLKVILIINH